MDWITNILKSVYRIKNIGTAIIEVDNEPAIKAVIGANLTKNLKHISSKYLYARLAYQERRMLFVYCKTDFLLSDALTKPLAGLKFFLFKLRLLGEYVAAHHLYILGPTLEVCGNMGWCCFQGFQFAHRNTMDIVEWSTNYPLIPMVIRLYT